MKREKKDERADWFVNWKFPSVCVRVDMCIHFVRLIHAHMYRDINISININTYECIILFAKIYKYISHKRNCKSNLNKLLCLLLLYSIYNRDAKNKC